MSGWIKLHRSLKDWEWYDDNNCVRLLIHLLVSVNYEDKKWRGKVVKAGSMVYSWSTLSDACGLSQQQCRTAMDKLQECGEVTRDVTNKYQTVTLVKWGKLQGFDVEDNRQITDKQQANNRQITTTKESKEYKEINNTLSNDKDKRTRFSALRQLKLWGVDEQISRDFLQNRKTKKLSNTQTAFDSLKKEIDKTGKTPNEIITICAEKGWGAFKASWNWNDKNLTNGFGQNSGRGSAQSTKIGQQDYD